MQDVDDKCKEIPNLHTFLPFSINSNLLSRKECHQHRLQCYGIYTIIRSHYSQMHILLFPLASNLLIHQSILHNACQISYQSKSYLWQSPSHYLAVALIDNGIKSQVLFMIVESLKYGSDLQALPLFATLHLMLWLQWTLLTFPHALSQIPAQPLICCVTLGPPCASLIFL